MLPCKCGCCKFHADVKEGWQIITVDDNGVIVNCDTNVSTVSEFICTECDEPARRPT